MTKQPRQVTTTDAAAVEVSGNEGPIDPRHAMAEEPAQPAQPVAPPLDGDGLAKLIMAWRRAEDTLIGRVQARQRGLFEQAPSTLTAQHRAVWAILRWVQENLNPPREKLAALAALLTVAGFGGNVSQWRQAAYGRAKAAPTASNPPGLEAFEDFPVGVTNGKAVPSAAPPPRADAFAPPAAEPAGQASPTACRQPAGSRHALETYSLVQKVIDLFWGRRTADSR